jgi:RNA polymerase sigma-70 factor (ECF subfamily)
VATTDQTVQRGDLRDEIAALYHAESRRVLATLIRLLGDFDLAEEALQDAFTAAVEQWPREGLPKNPRTWLVSVGRFRAIDALRRRARFDASLRDIADELDRQVGRPDEGAAIEDDRLRLIFTCCHPALNLDAQIALTLREVCGLTTEEIARAFMVSAPTVAQRIVRAKAKIREARIPYEIPERQQLVERLGGVLHVIYLLFNEGYAASAGDSLTRADLSAEAIRLGRLLVEMLPDGEAMGLLALMLLHESRRPARASANGDIVLLDEQDRSRWDSSMIAEGGSWLERALGTRSFGAYTLQAAIAAVHARSSTAAETDWHEIVALYDLLARVEATPVVRLNRAAAVAMRDGPAFGLRLIEEILTRGELTDYALAWSARAELCRRLGRIDDARDFYRRALELARQLPERRFLERQLDTLSLSGSRTSEAATPR